MSRWWTGLTPAQATVTCTGHEHTLRWDAGRLIALDHGDLRAEATLAALAGETFPCLELLAAWSRRRADPRVLTLASRGPADIVAIDLDGLRHRHEWPLRKPEEEILRLLALGGGMPDRLQATTAAIWARRLQHGHTALRATRPQLFAALYGRALRTLRTWLGEPELAIDLTMAAHDEPAEILRTADGLSVTLPFGWLAEVWAPGLAIIFGRLCLGAQADGTHLTLQTLGSDLRERSEITITIRAQPA